jgi:thiol-disulfide isomerase/thioredoxin
MTTIFTLSYIALWILVLLLCFVALDYLKRTRPRKRKLDLQDIGIPIGQPFPKQQFADLDGNTVPLTSPKKKGSIVLFTSSSCASCKALYPALQPYHMRHPELDLVVLMMGESDELEATKEKYGFTMPVSLSTAAEFADFQINTYPFAYYLSPDGKIRNKGGVAGGPGDLELLLQTS